MKTQLIAAIGFSLLFSVLLTSTAQATRYWLTLGAQGDGTVTPDNTNNPYPSGVIVTLTATASKGWYFDHWSGNASGNVNPLPVTMNSDLSITGNFLASLSYSLTLATNGQGSIGLNPPGGSYFSNTLVAATAVPAAGWLFAGWSGAFTGTNNPLSFAVDSNLSLAGTFAQLPAFEVQPAGVTNQVGSTVSFSAQAAGTGLLSYQWYFDGGTLANATGTTLALNNVAASQAGNYWVTATNNYGSATSHVATLTLTNAPGPTNVVTSPDEGSLLAAIAHGGWVGIRFSGTVTLTDTIIITNNVVLDGSQVTTTISGGNAVQLFYVAGGASLTISNLTLANGSATNNPSGGGAIYIAGGNILLAGCVLTNNTAQSSTSNGLACGGAIFNNGGTASLYQSVIIGNSAITGDGGQAMGGAIYQSSGALAISNSSFILNQAVGANSELSSPVIMAGPAYGGALAIASGRLNVDHSQFMTNQAIAGSGTAAGAAQPASGGAVYCLAQCLVSDSAFVGNQVLAGNNFDSSKGTAGCGGGIYNGGTLVANRCSFYLNLAEGGSAGNFGSVAGGDGLGASIFNAGQLEATNCTIALNSVVGAPVNFSGFGMSAASGNALGGGVFNGAGAIFVGMNLTVASNACSSPVGIPPAGFPTNGYEAGFVAGAQIANTNGSLYLHNSVLAYGGTSNAYGPIFDDGYNMCSDNSASLDSGSSFNNTDPLLGPLGCYGGTTLCMALLANSPAIDDADPNDFPSTDQRGYLRPCGAGPDIGAFEYGATAPAAPYLAMSSGAAGVGVSFTALPTFTYRVQSSADLKTWTDIMTIGPLAAETEINQMVTPPWYSHCYFRLIMQ
ncbi:MAG: choice-of-anchor Q domain-containing protein [Verrucomicrobiota bacterium]|jgi:hypothetical protein